MKRTSRNTLVIFKSLSYLAVANMSQITQQNSKTWMGIHSLRNYYKTTFFLQWAFGRGNQCGTNVCLAYKNTSSLHRFICRMLFNGHTIPHIAWQHAPLAFKYLHITPQWGFKNMLEYDWDHLYLCLSIFLCGLIKNNVLHTGTVNFRKEILHPTLFSPSCL